MLCWCFLLFTLLVSSSMFRPQNSQNKELRRSCTSKLYQKTTPTKQHFPILSSPFSLLCLLPFFLFAGCSKAWQCLAERRVAFMPFGTPWRESTWWNSKEIFIVGGPEEWWGVWWSVFLVSFLLSWFLWLLFVVWSVDFFFVFVCLFVCLFVCSFVRLFVRLFVCLFWLFWFWCFFPLVRTTFFVCLLFCFWFDLVWFGSLFFCFIVCFLASSFSFTVCLFLAWGSRWRWYSRPLVSTVGSFSFIVVLVWPFESADVTQGHGTRVLWTCSFSLAINGL